LAGIALLVLTLLTAASRLVAQPAAGARAQYVLLISIDGARPDGLRSVGIAPLLQEASFSMTAQTSPSHMSMVSGVGPDRYAAEQESVRSTFTTMPPIIDGNLDEQEWRPAQHVTLHSRAGGARCVFYFMNDLEALYVGVGAVDDTTYTGVATPGQFDNMAIWFKAEVGYWLYGTGRLRTDRIDWRNRRTFPFTSGAKGATLAPPVAPHMMYELRIPLSEIGVRPGEAVATGFHYWDNYDRGPSFWWPTNVSVFAPDRYGRLVMSPAP
jgi:hypothetical protein